MSTAEASRTTDTLLRDGAFPRQPSDFNISSCSLVARRLGRTAHLLKELDLTGPLHNFAHSIEHCAEPLMCTSIEAPTNASRWLQQAFGGKGQDLSRSSPAPLPWPPSLLTLLWQEKPCAQWMLLATGYITAGTQTCQLMIAAKPNSHIYRSQQFPG